MAYHVFTITITPGFRDALIARLTQIGSLGAVETDEGMILYFPETVLLSTITNELNLIKTILETSGNEQVLSYDHTMIPDQDWNETWKKGFVPIDVGDHFTILPTWEKKSADRINLIIDPAMAFGTGHHETTRSCLILMEKYFDKSANDRFLDLGTGTGLLAIAASKMGYRKILGVDTDPLATEAALKNIAINNVTNIEIRDGSIPDAGTSFDFIAANLISGVLVLLASGISASLNTPGMAVLSGILVGQEDDVIKSMEHAGLHCKEKLIDGKWVSLLVGH